MELIDQISQVWSFHFPWRNWSFRGIACVRTRSECVAQVLDGAWPLHKAVVQARSGLGGGGVGR